MVTGGAGFIGSHIVDELLKIEGSMVINIDKMGIGSDHKNLRDSALNYYKDISDVSVLDIFQIYKPDYIIHCAAESHVDRSISSPMGFVESNVVGTANILEGMRRYAPNARMVHISTDEVYGHLGQNDSPFNELSNMDPRSPYSASKAGSDMLAFSYRETYGLDITVTRCCNNYGPRQHSEKLIPTILRSLKNSKLIPIYGDGKNIREWIYVEDHVNAILEILHNHNQKKLYNIYGTARTTNLDMVHAILVGVLGDDITTEKVLDYVNFVADRPGHDFRYAMSTIYTEVESLTRQRDFKDGILQTIKHYW
jgi:dTDP-glucose 4,6-dehydratase